MGRAYQQFQRTQKARMEKAAENRLLGIEKDLQHQRNGWVRGMIDDHDWDSYQDKWDRRRDVMEDEGWDKQWMSRRGGIDPKAFEGLTQAERKEMFGKGMAPATQYIQWFERAADAMGYGNIKAGEEGTKQLRDLYEKWKTVDFGQDGWDYGDVEKFRTRKTSGGDVMSLWESFADQAGLEKPEAGWTLPEGWTAGRTDGAGGGAVNNTEAQPRPTDEPQIVGGADGWNSGLGDIINVLMGSILSGSGGQGYNPGNSSPWIGSNNYTPTGGW